MKFDPVTAKTLELFKVISSAVKVTASGGLHLAMHSQLPHFLVGCYLFIFSAILISAIIILEYRLQGHYQVSNKN